MGRRAYVPPLGLFVHDVESAWTRLDHEENARQTALIGELQRQERLELQARTFARKMAMREQWLNEMGDVLANVELNATPAGIEAAAKLLQTIATEIEPKADRFRVLTRMANDLQTANYHDAEAIRRRERDLNARWQRFQAALDDRRTHLERLSRLTALLADMDALASHLRQLEVGGTCLRRAQIFF